MRLAEFTEQTDFVLSVFKQIAHGRYGIQLFAMGEISITVHLGKDNGLLMRQIYLLHSK